MTTTRVSPSQTSARVSSPVSNCSPGVSDSTMMTFGVGELR